MAPFAAGDECPGAETSQLAQEYLLQVLASMFREKVFVAYERANANSLMMQVRLCIDFDQLFRRIYFPC